MSVEKLIEEASKTKPPFTPAQLTELKKVLKHNDTAPHGRRVTRKKMAAFFGMSESTFDRAIRVTLGRGYGSAE